MNLPDTTRPLFICADAITYMRSMPDKSIDMIFTSPPFKDEDVKGDYWQFYESFFIEASRICSKVIIIIHSATKLNELIIRHPPHRLMIWGKGISSYSYRFNPILVYQISEDYNINKRIWADCFGVPAVNNKWKIHKYQDSIILYKTIISMFKNCKSVLDPFVGSGTSGIACRSLGLSFIGIDIDPKCINIALKRIASSFEG